MVYAPHQWANDNILSPYGPINATRLNEMETGIANALLRAGDTMSGTLRLGPTSGRLLESDDLATYSAGTNARWYMRRDLQNTTGLHYGLSVDAQAKGTLTVSDRSIAINAFARDRSDVTNKTITGAANNGSGLIRITATAHGYSTSDRIAVYGVTGTTEANGAWTITVIDANTFDLQGSTFTNAYVSGGVATNRPMLYGVMATMYPSLDRGSLTGTAANGDDVNCFVGFNGGTGKGTDAYYLGRNSGIAGSEWATAFTVSANCDYGIRLNGTFANFGLDFNAGTFTGGMIRLKNNVYVVGRNAANSAEVNMFKLNASDEVQFNTTIRANVGNIIVTDGVNIVPGTTTGSKIGTSASQKIGLWNATPVVQPSSTGETIGFTAGGGTAVTDASTFTGNVGATAYRISDIVKHLKNIGLIAA